MIHATESEQAIIGAALYEAPACADAFERLKPEHFHSEVHGLIWQRIVETVRTTGIPDPGVIAERLRGSESFEGVGGMRYLADLANRAVTHSIGSHVELILDRAARRLISQLGSYAMDASRKLTEGTAEEILAEVERGAAEIAREGVKAPAIIPAGSDALDMIEAAWRGENLGTPTGIASIDRVTGGIRQEDVWVIGARTSVGKSVMGISLALGLAKQGRGATIFSLEMPRKEVQARIIADLTFELGRRENIKYSDLLKGRGTPQHHMEARQAARALQGLPVAISDVGGLTIDEIRAQALRQARTWERAGVKPGCILIDHIGLVRPVRKTDNKAADTSDTVNELKAIAKAVRCPVIALSQINRGPESRNDKRPTVADLNWSGAIEQIADFICLLYREAYYKERSPNEIDRAEAEECANDLELLIHKNRSGPICNLKAYIDVASNAVRDMPEWRGAA